MAAATFSAGFGGVILVPLNAWLLESGGALAGGLGLAMIVLAGILPVVAWVIRDSPEAMGLERQDLDPDRSDETDNQEAHWSVASASRTVAFWAIAGGFMLVMLAQAGFLVQQVMFLQARLGFTTAAWIVSASTVASLVGRTLLIGLGNRLSTRTILAVTAAFQAVGFLVCALAEDAVGLTVGSLIWGSTVGIMVSLPPAITAECFGRVSFGRVYGPVYMGLQIGSALGPMVFGATSEALGSYRPMIVAASAALLLAGLAFQLARPPRRSSTLAV
jgi:MFS family permease